MGCSNGFGWNHIGIVSEPGSACGLNRKVDLIQARCIAVALGWPWPTPGKKNGKHVYFLTPLTTIWCASRSGGHFVSHRPFAGSGESTQIAPQTIGVALRQERFNFQVGILPDRRSVGEQSSALSRQAHPSTTPVCRIWGYLDQAATLQRLELRRSRWCDPWPAATPPTPCPEAQDDSTTSAKRIDRWSGRPAAMPRRNTWPVPVPPAARADRGNNREPAASFQKEQ